MITQHASRSRGGRQQTQTTKQPDAQLERVIAPLRGWVENDSLASSDLMGARILDDYYVTERALRVRGGRTRVADIGEAVTSVFSYNSSGLQRLFAASATAVYDITALDPNTVPTADYSGQTGGTYTTAQIGTAGGQFMYAVNGSDTPRYYDGSTWTTSTMTGATIANLSHVFLHKSRLWFTDGTSQSAYYLPVDSVTGALSEFTLRGVFQLGGRLLFGTTYSADSGSGLDDRAVFVSDRGEVAVYEGTDPSSASTWGLVGVYKMAPPLGKNAFEQTAGDVIFATEQGIFSLTALMSKPVADLRATAVTEPISTSWRFYAGQYDAATSIEMLRWPTFDVMFVSLPSSDSDVLVSNMRTTAWSRFRNWDIQSMTIYNDLVYFGSANGYIYLAQSGGTDDGEAYTSRVSMAPRDMGSPATYKSVSLSRATLSKTVGTILAQISFDTNYGTTFPAIPAAAPDFSLGALALWDAGLWDTALWDDSALPDLITEVGGWQSQGATGFAVSPQVQITTSMTNAPTVEFNALDIVYSSGGAVT